MKYHRYTEEDRPTVVEAVASSVSIRQALMKMGLAPKGGNYATFKRLVERWDLDTSHFLGRTQGLVPYEKKPIEEFLVKDSRTDGSYVRKRILEDNIKPHKCENCTLTEWLNEPIPLEIHHVNGNSRDHRIENLQLLCPNCHHLTDNFRGRNISRS